MARKNDDGFGKDWIIKESMEILSQYVGTPMTVRQLYYRLIALKQYPNGQKYYKRIVSATTFARKDGAIDFDAFVDRERALVGSTEISRDTLQEKIEHGQWAMRYYVANYNLNKWHFQNNYIEVWIEKKALEGVFQSPCSSAGVGLFACKGYPSLTALYEAYERFSEAEAQGKTLTIIYFGDHDASGDDIPRSIIQNLSDMGVDVELDRRALTREQVLEYGLPPAPSKKTDSRTAGWDGLGQVELDALEPKLLQSMTKEAIEDYVDKAELKEYKDTQASEKVEYIKAMKDYVESGAFEGDL